MTPAAPPALPGLQRLEDVLPALSTLMPARLREHAGGRWEVQLAGRTCLLDPANPGDRAQLDLALQEETLLRGLDSETRVRADAPPGEWSVAVSVWPAGRPRGHGRAYGQDAASARAAALNESVRRQAPGH